MVAARPFRLPSSTPEHWPQILESEAARRLGAFDAALLRRMLDEQAVDPECIERALNAYARANSLGALAANRGWLSMKQIFDILSEQAVTAEPFEIIAVRRGALTEAQVATLTEEQTSQAPLMTIAELLVRMGLHLAEEEQEGVHSRCKS